MQLENETSRTPEETSQEISEDPVVRDASSPKVLVVDDNNELLFVLDEILSSEGFNPILADGVAKALEFLKDSPPDLIVCDVMMPGVNGFEFHHQVREQPEWSNIPFVFLTALSDPNDIRQGKEAGCDDYLVKPFDPMDLIASIRGKLVAAKIRKSATDDKMDDYRKRIIHTLSHEFRTPLVAINTGTELLLEQQDKLDTERTQKLLETVQRGGQRMLRLVEDFMTMQQIDSGSAMAIQKRLCAKHYLSDIVSGVIEDFSDEHPQGASLISREGGLSGTSIINVFDVQVGDALRRILANCEKFGGKNPIVIRIEEQAGSAAVLVRDFGPGISEEVAQTACQLFSQIGREKLEQQGCGVGLTIASYFIHLNGGTLRFNTPLDGKGGLEVEIAFPTIVEQDLP